MLAGGLDEAGDDAAAGLVVRVRLAGEDELQAARVQVGQQAVELAQHQVAALVGRRPPGEADEQAVFGQGRAGASLDLGEQLGLERLVYPPELAADLRRMEGGPHAPVLPTAGMDAVGDRVQGGGVADVPPHRPRRDPVAIGDSIGAHGQAQARHGHVEGVAAEAAQIGAREAPAGAELLELVEGVRFVAGLDRRVGREDDLRAHRRPGGLEAIPFGHAFGDAARAPRRPRGLH